MGSDSLTLKYRGIVVEDLAVSNSVGQTVATVLGLGTNIPVTPLLSAPDDTAAAVAGISTGDVYIANGTVPIRLRAMGVAGVQGATGSLYALTGFVTVTPGEIRDGDYYVVSPTVSIVGCVVGDGVFTGCIPALPPGTFEKGKVTTNGQVTIEIYNFSGLGGVNLGLTTINVAIIH